MFPDVPFSPHPRPRLSICALTPIALHTTAAMATASTLLKASGFQGSPGSYSWSPPALLRKRPGSPASGPANSSLTHCGLFSLVLLTP